MRSPRVRSTGSAVPAKGNGHLPKILLITARISTNTPTTHKTVMIGPLMPTSDLKGSAKLDISAKMAGPNRRRRKPQPIAPRQPPPESRLMSNTLSGMTRAAENEIIFVSVVGRQARRMSVAKPWTDGCWGRMPPGDRAVLTLSSVTRHPGHAAPGTQCRLAAGGGITDPIAPSVLCPFQTWMLLGSRRSSAPATGTSRRR